MEKEKQEQSEKTKEETLADMQAYEKPAFRYERVFETMALACGKVNASERQCGLNRKNS